MNTLVGNQNKLKKLEKFGTLKLAFFFIYWIVTVKLVEVIKHTANKTLILSL